MGRYFDLVADGSKTIGVRVRYPNLRRLKAGGYIGSYAAATTPSPGSSASPAAPHSKRCSTPKGRRKHPASPRDQQLASIRRVYGPEKEALGVLAIEIELVAEPAT